MDNRDGEEGMAILKGKTALVTGAARGIGKAIALKLAEAGANVVVADVLKEDAEAVAGAVRDQGVKALVCGADVSDSGQVTAMVQSAVDEMGRLDILINNAGITRDGMFMRMSDENWDLVLKINLKGTALCSQAAARVMSEQLSGKIVNIASVIGLRGNAGQANYAASKAGVIGLTRSLARELGPQGVNVNAIAPGFIETAMTEELPEETRQAYSKGIPLGRFGQPSDVADLALFLSSQAADYITGQVIALDGGMTSQ